MKTAYFFETGRVNELVVLLNGFAKISCAEEGSFGSTREERIKKNRKLLKIQVV